MVCYSYLATDTTDYAVDLDGIAVLVTICAALVFTVVEGVSGLQILRIERRGWGIAAPMHVRQRPVPRYLVFGAPVRAAGVDDMRRIQWIRSIVISGRLRSYSPDSFARIHWTTSVVLGIM